MDYLIVRNDGDRTLAAIEEIVGAVGPVMVFEPGTYEASTFHERFAQSLREAPNTPITLVMNFKESTFANWTSPFLEILQSRFLMGETLPAASNIIFLSETDATLTEAGMSALLARLHVIDLKAVVGKFLGNEAAIIDHEIGHLAYEIGKGRNSYQKPVSIAVLNNILDPEVGPSVPDDFNLTGSADEVMEAWRELADKHPAARVLGRVSQDDSVHFNDFYFKEGQLMAKRGVHREMLAENGPMPSLLSRDPSDHTTWALKLEAIKAKPDESATEAQIAEIKRAIELGQFQIEISPLKKKTTRTIERDVGL